MTVPAKDDCAPQSDHGEFTNESDAHPVLRLRGMDFRVGQFASYGRRQLRLRTVGFDFPRVLASVGDEIKPIQNLDGLPQAVHAVRKWQQSGCVEHDLEMGSPFAALEARRKPILKL